MVRQAWKTMVTGRPGPVVLDVPFDIFKEAAAERRQNPKNGAQIFHHAAERTLKGVLQAVNMLLSAKRPVIVVGQGVRYAEASELLVSLAERLQIPVASSASGLGAISVEHALSLGLVQRGGTTKQIIHADRQMFYWLLACALTTARLVHGFLGTRSQSLPQNSSILILILRK